MPPKTKKATSKYQSESEDDIIDNVKKTIHVTVNKLPANKESDTSDSEEYNSDSETEPEHESESDKSDNEQVKPDKKSKKKEKENKFNNSLEKINEFYTELDELELVQAELEKELKTVAKKINDNYKQIRKLYSGLSKQHQDELKDRPKRTNTSKSGILKESQVPPVLIKLLGLEDNVMMPRTTVMSLVNTKFKELGLKTGQKTTLDAKTAKLFGLKAGHEIGFSDFQRFLADIYDNAFKKNTVTL